MQGPPAPGGYGPDGGPAGQYPPPQQYQAVPPQQPQHYAGAPQAYAGGPPQDQASAYPPAGAGLGGGPGAGYAVRDPCLLSARPIALAASACPGHINLSCRRQVSEASLDECITRASNIFSYSTRALGRSPRLTPTSWLSSAGLPARAVSIRPPCSPNIRSMYPNPFPPSPSCHSDV